MKQRKIWHENKYKNCGQYLTIDKEIYKGYTKYQDLFFFKNNFFGNVFSLNNIINTTEYDEFIYNEIISHIPMISHGHAKNILILGGGNGGILREILKYKKVKKITMIELDIKIIKYCKLYLPNISLNSFENPKLKLKIYNNFNFIKNNKKKFDIIISDFNNYIIQELNFIFLEFYINCKKYLNKNGIIIIKNGVLPIDNNLIIKNFLDIKKIFKKTIIFKSFIPSYYGGIMTFLYATNNLKKNNNNYYKIYKRFLKNKLLCKYYNPLVHINSFILPKYISNIYNL
ncbi:Spermidine synthase [Candidatus Annandia adelgestsuga]|uniref:Polyamine aminopropyltransferase n=1 Tax=Candidatus Annandia adelgestsuga TaxID=1302411 RepID=A0A3S9J7L2_9ENTR|nr:polyamine aminopropyltransferase [Candidatus Annandia adelgestsuga]AZP36361.1 Spermidine synthase [Candidatus Annandia adelgestsuga]